MYSTFHLNFNELDNQFLERLRIMFANQKLIITVETEMDETEYILQHPENKKAVLKSLEQANRGELICVDLDEL